MNLVKNFFELEGNQIVLNFAHGLIFFLLGFSVLLKGKRWSELTLAKSLPWLGLFGIINGMGDWGLVFIPIQTYVFSPKIISGLWLIDTVLLSLSYALLLFCGVHLLARTRSEYSWLPKIVPVAYGIWLVAYLVSGFFSEPAYAPDHPTFISFEIAYRYGFAFVGSLVMAWALSLQRQELERLNLNESIRPLQWVGYSFVLHAIAAGLIVPAASFFPANLINDRILMEVAGMPVRLFTGVSGAIVAVSMLLSLEVFDAEFARRLDDARQFHTVMQERTRIARDLHDGIIQTLYAVGLGLEGVTLSLDEGLGSNRVADDGGGGAKAPGQKNVRVMAEKERLRIRDEIQVILGSLDRAIRDVRRYIMQLKVPTQDFSLDEHLHVFVREIQRETSIPIRIKADPVELGVLPPEAVMDLLLIVREAISNAARHAKASEIKVALVRDERGISLSIVDDGMGFEPEKVPVSAAGEHMGLENMRRRAASIGGHLSIHSDVGFGTEILLRIPLYP